MIGTIDVTSLAFKGSIGIFVFCALALTIAQIVRRLRILPVLPVESWPVGPVVVVPPREMCATCRFILVFRNGTCVVSCWQLSPAEIDEVARTGKVWLSVFSGMSAPPVCVGGEEEIRGVVADYGGPWPRGQKQ